MYEEIRNLKELEQVLKSNIIVDRVQHLLTKSKEKFKIKRKDDELFWLGKVNQKKLLMLSAKAALYEASNMNLFTSKPSLQTRFTFSDKQSYIYLTTKLSYIHSMLIYAYPNT